MPQPLRDIPPDMLLGPNSMTLRPALAMLIARISANWTIVEQDQGIVLGLLLKAEAERALAMYLALTSAPARSAALKAVARRHLDAGGVEAFEALMKETGGAQRQRNVLIHATWATSACLPDALLKSEPEQQVTHYTMALAQLPEPWNPELLDAYQDALAERLPEWWIWEEHDFLEVENRIIAVAMRWSTLQLALLNKGSWP